MACTDVVVLVSPRAPTEKESSDDCATCQNVASCRERN
jgi:hypothetical protein